MALPISDATMGRSAAFAPRFIKARFRTAALNALGQAGILREVTLTSPSLACVATAAEAGLGVAVRTNEILSGRRPKLAQAKKLPTLPNHHMRIYNGANDTNLAIRKLTDFWLQQFKVS